MNRTAEMSRQRDGKPLNYLGFDRKKVADVAENLNDLLANYHVYYQNIRNFHWNVNGENFFALHAKFEELYEDARIKIDEIAERVLALRHRPMSLLSEYLTHAEVEEAPVLEHDRDMVATLLENHKMLIEKMRNVLKAAQECSDDGTNDMIGGFLENLEKKSWMLDAWLHAK